MNESITIILPLPAKVLSPNCAVGSIGGRFAKAAATKKYRRLAREAVEAEYIETMPWKVSVGVWIHYRTHRRRDGDNAIASLKAAYDGIRDSGLIADDDFLHLKHSIPMVDIDKEYPRVVIKIEKIDS